MAKDAKEKVLGGVRRAQAKIDHAQGQLEQAQAARRESFEQARAAGFSLAEIGRAAGLHRSRVDQILRGR